MKRLTIIALAFSAGLLAGQGAWAQKPPEPPPVVDKAPPKEAPKALVRQEEVISQIQRQSPGGRLQGSIRTETQSNGQVVYRVPWLTAAPENRRIDYVVDAQTGRILSPGR
ncbi:MAG: PepSY domain-containing protein [Alphaproteobacteria bacterium]